MALNKRKGKTTDERDTPVDIVGGIMRYEEGEMEPHEAREFFAHLHNNGAIHHLQGSYGRQFQRYLNSKEIVIDDNGKATAQEPEE